MTKGRISDAVRVPTIATVPRRLALGWGMGTAAGSRPGHRRRADGDAPLARLSRRHGRAALGLGVCNPVGVQSSASPDRTPVSRERIAFFPHAGARPHSADPRAIFPIAGARPHSAETARKRGAARRGSETSQSSKWQAFFDAITEQRLTHDLDPTLARYAANLSLIAYDGVTRVGHVAPPFIVLPTGVG